MVRPTPGQLTLLPGGGFPFHPGRAHAISCSIPTRCGLLPLSLPSKGTSRSGISTRLSCGGLSISTSCCAGRRSPPAASISRRSATACRQPFTRLPRPWPPSRARAPSSPHSGRRKPAPCRPQGTARWDSTPSGWGDYFTPDLIRRYWPAEQAVGIIVDFRNLGCSGNTCPERCKQNRRLSLELRANR